MLNIDFNEEEIYLVRLGIANLITKSINDGDDVVLNLSYDILMRLDNLSENE